MNGQIYKNKDLIGERFNSLVITGAMKGAPYLITCTCDCGISIAVKRYDVFYGKIKSCGCFKVKMRKEFTGPAHKSWREDTPNKHAFKSYKRDARKRNLVFELSFEDFDKLVQAPCWFCGAAPSFVKSVSNQTHRIYIANGVDRLNNQIGYSKDNCVSCCKRCNFIKSYHSLDSFLDMCQKVATLHKKED